MAKSTSLNHVAIIMDGNRRWARQHKLELLRGHEKVANEVIQQLVDRATELNIAYLTLWAFSTENWQRDEGEVTGILNLLRSAFSRNAAELHEKGVKLNTIGNLSKFPKDIQESVAKWVEISKNNTKITVTFALNYGGRDEILRAMNALRAKEPSDQPITEEIFSSYLDTNTLPDPDLIIRPGGEKRLSGLLPWQSTYSELYFTDVLMPDFGPAELDKAVADFQVRQRRFGTWFSPLKLDNFSAKNWLDDFNDPVTTEE